MFIQSQVIPWEEERAYGADVTAKTLSEDSDSGASTCLVRYPADYQMRGALDVAEELLVLDGAVDINGVHYPPYGYAYLPARCLAVRASSAGAVALTTLSGIPRAVEPDPRVAPVANPDTMARGLEGWTKNPYTRYLPGTGVQPLWEDPTSGEISILYSALPFRYMAKRWSHTHVQEMYLLAGEYAINDVGLMMPGAYAWWEGGRFHGPYGSRTGFMMFIRSVGGPLENIIEPDLIDVNYCPPYRPVLPPRLRPLAKPVESSSNY